MSEQLPFNLPQGAKAVRSGRYGEFAIEAAFRAYHVRTVSDNPEYHYEKNLWERKEKFLIRQHTLKGGRTIDFLYKNFASDLSLPIECKQQMGSGTTDEKLSYTVDELEKCGYPVFWLVLSGEGFNPRVIRRIEDKIRNINTKGNVKGRLLFNYQIQRAVEQLVDHGQAIS